jgi:N-acetylglucosamine-6-phosphate deacetylase
MLLHGGDVVLPDRTVVPADVLVVGDRIAAIRRRDDEAAPPAPTGDGPRLDVTGHLIAPGYLDLQLNGGFGFDVTSDARCIPDLARRLPSTGVTAFLPTVVTSPPVARQRALDVMTGSLTQRPGTAPTGGGRTGPLGSDDAGADAETVLDPRRGTGAVPLGLHFEGPVLAGERRGAHRAEFLGMPEAAELRRWTRADGLALVTLAPEVPGALELIARLTAAGVAVSIGHTGCTPAEFAAARAAGATAVTHLFNAMAPFSHRAPGPIGATLADPSVVAGLIVDGIHVDPTAIAMAWRSLGTERTCLVTDAVAALGMPEGTLTLGGREIRVGPDGVRTPEGVLAGSNLTLDRAVRNLVAFTGCTAAEAISTVTTVPARLLGLADRGRVEVGARADLVVLDSSLRPRRTIVGGWLAFDAEHDPHLEPSPR